MEKKSYPVIAFLATLLTYSLVNGEEAGNKISLWLKAALNDLTSVARFLPPSIQEPTIKNEQMSSLHNEKARHSKIDPKVFTNRKRLLSWYFEPYNGNYASSFIPYDIKPLSYSRAIDEEQDQKEGEEFENSLSIKHLQEESAWEDENPMFEDLVPDHSVLDQKLLNKHDRVALDHEALETLVDDDESKKKEEVDERARERAAEVARKRAEEERERLKKLEKERLEKERLEKERLEKERLEKEAAARKKAEEEAARKKAEEEAARNRADEEAARKKAEEEATALKKAEEEIALKKAEEEAARKKAEEEEARKIADEEAIAQHIAATKAARLKQERHEAAAKFTQAELKRQQDEIASILTVQQLASAKASQELKELQQPHDETAKRAEEIRNQQMRLTVQTDITAAKNDVQPEDEEADLTYRALSSIPKTDDVPSLRSQIPEPHTYINTTWLRIFVQFLDKAQQFIPDEIEGLQNQLRELKRQQALLAQRYKDSLTHVINEISELEATKKDHHFKQHKIVKSLDKHLEEARTQATYTQDLFTTISRQFGALKKVIVEHREKLLQAKDIAEQEFFSAQRLMEKIRTEILELKKGISCRDDEFQQARSEESQLRNKLIISQRAYNASFDQLQETLTIYLQQMVRETLNHPQKDEFWPIYVDHLKQLAINFLTLPTDEIVKVEVKAFCAKLSLLEFEKAVAQVNILMDLLPSISTQRRFILDALNTIFEKNNEIRTHMSALKELEEKQQFVQKESQKASEKLKMLINQENDLFPEMQKTEMIVAMKQVQYRDFLESTKLLTDQEELKDPAHLVGLARLLPQAPQSPTKTSIFVLMKDFERAKSDLKKAELAVSEKKNQLDLMKEKEKELQVQLQKRSEDLYILKIKFEDSIKPIEQTIVEHHRMLDKYRTTRMFLQSLSLNVQDGLREFANSVPISAYETTSRAYLTKVEEIETYFSPNERLSLISEQHQRWKSEQQAAIPFEADLPHQSALTTRQHPTADEEHDPYRHKRSISHSNLSLAEELALVTNGSAGIL